jgi:selenocysteine-specific elongation factor
MPRGEFRTRMQALLPGVTIPVKLANQVFAEAERKGVLGGDEQTVWRAGFAPTPTKMQQAAVDRLMAEFSKAPFAPPNLQDCQRLLNNDTELMNMLIEQGGLIRLGGDVLLRGEDFTVMVEAIMAHLRDRGTITMAETRDLFNTSRKYAQAVLEEMDARRLTRRDGDLRVLR